MYLRRVRIRNIRAITNFDMDLPNAAGWNVLIGDNGSGKSSIIRAIALALIGPEEALGLRADWRDWLSHQSIEGRIRIDISKGDTDKHTGRQAKLKNWLIANIIQFKRQDNNVEYSVVKTPKIDPFRYNWGRGEGWFSVAYGPYRRFAGGNQEWTKVFYSQPKLGAHLSAFGEDIALTEAIEWLVKLNYQLLEKKEPGRILYDLEKLINSPDFLPHKAEIESISSDGVVFRDGNGSLIPVNQLSDGYRSILSLAFELIRQLVRVYGATNVFKEIKNDNMIIDLPGVVLIDEIDAHLHPSWQIKIGQWFTKHFPKIQFIVTTHSPLICRACENGSIWRLATPGKDMFSGEVKGIERNRLIYGNILDAFGTDIFGENISISEEANEKKLRFGELNLKSVLEGILSDEEANELKELKKIFATEKFKFSDDKAKE
jgi:predicted ATPase